MIDYDKRKRYTLVRILDYEEFKLGYTDLELGMEYVNLSKRPLKYLVWYLKKLEEID